MKAIGEIDDSLPTRGTCMLCGRLFDLNEVQTGIFLSYFLLHRGACPCPTCFGSRVHRVEDPDLETVFLARRFLDTAPSRVIRNASVWNPGHPLATH